MSLTQGFPSTFSTTQTTIDVLHNLDNETKKIYNDVNAIMAADGHSHTGNGSDGAVLPQIASLQTSIDTKTQVIQTSVNAQLATMQTTIDNINVEVPGLTNFIASGRIVTAGTGLSANISAGRNSINGFVNDYILNTISLSPRMTSLIYDKLDGTSGKVDASFPAVSTQTLRYLLDGSATISNTGTGGANVATKTGTVTATDGRIDYSGLGSTTGYYTCASATGVPAFTSASTRVLVIDNFVSNGAIQIFHNDGISSYGCTATNLLTVNGAATSFELTNGGAYKITLPADASITSASVYVNGVNVATGAYITNATAVAPTFYSGAAGTSKSPSQLAYFEYYATKFTPTQIAQISNALLFPCSYNGVDIRSILPPNSISLGYAKTNSTSVIEIDSNSYKYGIRQGVVGGNRKVFLGWKYFSGATYFSWENPFGTRKVKTYFTWAQDANGINESDIDSGFLSSAEYGRRFYNTSSSRIRIQIGSGGACIFNGSWQASGYIGCYAEVIE